MKRRELVRHLDRHGCELLREGANHSIYVNRAAGKTSAVSRHSEINNDLAEDLQGLEHSIPISLTLDSERHTDP